MANSLGGHGSTGGLRYPKCRCGHAKSKHRWVWDDPPRFTRGHVEKCTVKNCHCIAFDERPEETIP